MCDQNQSRGITACAAAQHLTGGETVPANFPEAPAAAARAQIITSMDDSDINNLLTLITLLEQGRHDAANDLLAGIGLPDIQRPDAALAS